jgi:hypothetical protein
MKPAPTTGSPIQRTDLENRLRTLKSDVDTVKDSAVGAGVVAVGAIAILLVIIAFLIGRNRRRG